MASEKAKPWQIVVVALGGVAALGAVGYYMFFAGDGAVKLASDVTLVDVNTGELFTFDVGGGKALVIPEDNPKTGKRNLLAAEKTAEGKWALTRRAMGQLGSVEQDATAVVDKKTGELKVASETVQRGR